MIVHKIVCDQKIDETMENVATAYLRSLVPGVEDSRIFHQLEYLRWRTGTGEVQLYGGGGYAEPQFVGPFYSIVDKGTKLYELQKLLQERMKKTQDILAPLVTRDVQVLAAMEQRAEELFVHWTAIDAVPSYFLGLRVYKIGGHCE